MSVLNNIPEVLDAEERQRAKSRNLEWAGWYCAWYSDRKGVVIARATPEEAEQLEKTRQIAMYPTPATALFAFLAAQKLRQSEIDRAQRGRGVVGRDEDVQGSQSSGPSRESKYE